METFFRKHFWTVQAAAAIIVALLLSAGVTGFIAARLVGFAVTTSAPAEDGSRGSDHGSQRSDLPLTVFGPEPEDPVEVSLCDEVTCAPGQRCDPDTGGCVDEEPEDDTTDEQVLDERCTESDIAINLVGTMVAEDPRFSLAILQNPTTNKTQFARAGTNLLAEADVLRVERNRVTLLRNGREECLRYGDQATRAQRARANDPADGPTTGSRLSAVAPDGPSARAQAAPAAPQGGTFDDRVRTGVRRNQDGSYDIDRSLVAEVANNQSLMEQQAPNVSPHYVNGQARGFQLQGIRTGSLFSRIGIRNNDVIVAVNDTAVDSPQRAMELYDAMMSQNEVRVVVQRRGRNQTLVYNVR
jgi:general secretion pathway protein C